MYDAETDPNPLDTYAIVDNADNITPYLGRTKSAAIDAMLGPIRDLKERRRVWEQHRRAGYRVETVTVMSTARDSFTRQMLNRCKGALLPEKGGMSPERLGTLITALRRFLP